MLTKILTLRYSPELGVIDDAPLRALGHDHEIVSVREHFFVTQELPHLLCVVSCRERGAPAKPITQPAKDTKSDLPPARRASSDPPPDFDDDQRELFDAIRRWRAAEAERAGVPRYVLLTNRDVELLVRARPDTLGALRRLPGFGKAKVEKHGQSLLALLHPEPDKPHLVPEPESEREQARP